MIPRHLSPCASLVHNPHFHHHLSKSTTTPFRRYISAYGYTQAKCLVYSKYSEPKDVLSSVLSVLPPPPKSPLANTPQIPPLSLHTHSISPPYSNLLTLRTLAAPLNPADINQIQGTYPSLPPLTTALGTPHPATVPGSEACFQVLATGSAVPPSIRPGDWVIPRAPGLGTWRTHLQVPFPLVQPIPRTHHLRPLQVATVAVNPVTAWRLLTDFVPLDASRGDWFIQNGANSAVGRAAIQLGRRWGHRSIAVVRDRPGDDAGVLLRRELEALGATHVVTDTELRSSAFPSRVREWTAGGGGVRLALNGVGGTAATAMAKVLEPGGHVVTYGAMGRQPLQLPAGQLIFRNIVFEGFWVSRWSEENPAERERTVEALLELMRGGEWVDGPVVEIPWEWETGREALVEAVQGTMEGFRAGKGVFVFGET